jgi:hypothetical protein
MIFAPPAQLKYPRLSVFISGSEIQATVIPVFDLYFFIGETTWAAKQKSGY